MSRLPPLSPPVAFASAALLTLTVACAGGLDPDGRGDTQAVPSEDSASTHSEDDDTGASSQGGVSAGATTTGSTSTSTTTGTTMSTAPWGGSTGDGETEDGSSGDGSTGAVDPTETGGETGEVPSEVDLSGWAIRQTDSSREIALPAGSVLKPGATVLVIRGATVASFEVFWNQPIGVEVVVVDGNGEFPAINGGETFTLVDPTGATVDGPTPVVEPGTLLIREEPVEEDEWTFAVANTSTASPGDGHASDGDRVPYISEVADATGNGAYDFEFIELRLR